MSSFNELELDQITVLLCLDLFVVLNLEPDFLALALIEWRGLRLLYVIVFDESGHGEVDK